MVNANDNFLYRTPNVVIGVCFLWVGLCVLWLWSHRRGDWPKAWSLILITLCFLVCGVSRFLHALAAHSTIVAVGDWASAFTGLIASPLIPWAVYEIARFPTPKELEETTRIAATAKEAARQAAILAQQNEVMRRQTAILKAIFNQSPGLPETLKTEVKAILESMGQ
jgi:hypothetical protein